MPEENAGLMGSLKRMLSTLISMASTRLELLANELQEERLRLTQMFFFALLAMFFFGVFVLLLVVFILILFWDDYRIAALCGLGIVFFALGTLMTVLLRRLSREKSDIFSASLAELAKDRVDLAAGASRSDGHE